MQNKIFELDNEAGPIKALVYGPPGTGKTRFCFSGEPKFKTLILSAEAGLLSLKKIQRELGVKAKVWTITSLEDLVQARDYLYNADHDFDLVAIDSLTEIQTICMEAILKVSKRETAEIKDWGTLNNKMVSIVRSFRDLPDMHVICTALDEQIKDENTGEVKTVPLFQGRIQKTIAAYFDEVMYSHVIESPDGKSVRHQLLTRNNGRFTGKDRSGMLPIVIEPDFKKMNSMIHPVKEEK